MSEKRRVYRKPPGMAAPGVKRPGHCALCTEPAVTTVGEHRLCERHKRLATEIVERAAASRKPRTVTA